LGADLGKKKKRQRKKRRMASRQWRRLVTPTSCRVS
jgi:hypothetical protein